MSTRASTNPAIAPGMPRTGNTQPIAAPTTSRREAHDRLDDRVLVGHPTHLVRGRRRGWRTATRAARRSGWATGGSPEFARRRGTGRRRGWPWFRVSVRGSEAAAGSQPGKATARARADGWQRASHAEPDHDRELDARAPPACPGRPDADLAEQDRAREHEDRGRVGDERAVPHQQPGEVGDHEHDEVARPGQEQPHRRPSTAAMATIRRQPSEGRMHQPATWATVPVDSSQQREGARIPRSRPRRRGSATARATQRSR